MIKRVNALTLHHNHMARKGSRQKKARVPKKNDRVGLSTTASTPTTTKEAPKKTEAYYERELRRLMGAKVTKT